MADATETVGTEGTTDQRVTKRVIGQTTRRRSSTRPATLVAGRPAVIPGGRAVLGALLVVLAALLTFVAYTRANRRPTTRYVVAAADLEPGAAIGPSDIELVTVLLPASLRSRSIDRTDDLIGATVLGPVAKGELIQLGNVIKKAGGPGSREFSFPIDAAFAAGGRVRSGDRIDVVATIGTGTAAVTQIIASNVLVAHVDRPSGRVGSTRDTLVITLALDGDVDSIPLAHAVAMGTLMLIRTTGTGAGTSASATEAAAPPLTAPEAASPSSALVGS